jgi:hypothetical protein
LKRTFLVLEILGILLILFGTVFALQGDGIIGGSVMSGNTFWIYAGSTVAVIGLILVGTGFVLGSGTQRTAAEKVGEGITK